MSFTTLRVVEAGVVLYEGHRARLGETCRAEFEAFARTATPGVYALFANGSELQVVRREGSRLHEGITTRHLPSPMAALEGAFAKPRPPSAYDGVRAPGVATLLTSADGVELYESCTASLIGWNGEAFVLVPSMSPRVDSVAERAIASLKHVRAPLRADGDWPLLLVNAVAGTVAPTLPRPAFPPAERAHLDALLASSVRRP